MQFSGTKNYVSTVDLTVAVNASIAIEKPLLVKGEPGTGNRISKTSCRFFKSSNF